MLNSSQFSLSPPTIFIPRFHGSFLHRTRMCARTFCASRIWRSSSLSPIFNKVRVNADSAACGWRVPFYRVPAGNSCEERASAGLAAAATRKTFNAIYGGKKEEKETDKNVYINMYMYMHIRRKTTHVIDDDFYIERYKFC